LSAGPHILKAFQKARYAARLWVRESMNRRIWLGALLALLAADLLLGITGTRILIRQQRGQAWLVGGGLIVSTRTDVSRYADKRKIPVLGCTYWTGWGTRMAPHPFAPPTQNCPWIAR
jgi:hypothetical protein